MYSYHHGDKKHPYFGLCFFVAPLAFLAFTHLRKDIISPEKLLSCFTSRHERYVTDVYCPERVVGDLLVTRTAGDLLTYITTPPTPLAVRLYAHSISHFIGKQTFLKTRSVGMSLSQCVPDSQSGCVHGVIGAAATEELGMSPTRVLALCAPRNTQKTCSYCSIALTRIP